MNVKTVSIAISIPLFVGFSVLVGTLIVKEYQNQSKKSGPPKALLEQTTTQTPAGISSVGGTMVSTKATGPTGAVQSTGDLESQLQTTQDDGSVDDLKQLQTDVGSL